MCYMASVHCVEYFYLLYLLFWNILNLNLTFAISHKHDSKSLWWQHGTILTHNLEIACNKLFSKKRCFGASFLILVNNHLFAFWVGPLWKFDWIIDVHILCEFVIFFVQTPLHLACLSGDLTTVEHIVDMVGTEYLLQLHGLQIKSVRVVLRHPFFKYSWQLKIFWNGCVGCLLVYSNHLGGNLVHKLQKSIEFDLVGELYI